MKFKAKQPKMYKVYTKQHPEGLIRKARNLKRLLYTITAVQRQTLVHVDTYSPTHKRFINQEMPEDVRHFFK